MGHDITAIRKSSNQELSYIRIGAWNHHKAYMLYESLNAQNCNGGVSGNGNEKEFTPEELKIALSKFKYMRGEPRDEIIAEMESSEGTKNSDKFLGSLMTALTGRPLEKSDPDDVQMKSNNEDILRFLTEIQVEEPVIIQFF